jgi:diguanylate cyclase (GGDEF)-like protein
MVSKPTDTYETLIQFLYRAPIGLIQSSLNGMIEMLNPKAAQLLMPLSPDGNLDNFFSLLGDVAPQLRLMTEQLGQSSGVVCESLRVELHADTCDRSRPLMLSISLMKLDESRLMAVLEDATLETERERRTLAHSLNDAARIDSLTRLPNRAAIREQLQRMVEQTPADARSDFAVLFVNCDRFKQINDTLGHAAGDQVLVMIAERLQATLSQRKRIGTAMASAQMAGRIGGDEFVVVLDDMHGRQDVGSIASRVLDVLAAPYYIESRQIIANVSMGIVMPGPTERDADAVLLDASIAMVEAKHAGGASFAMFNPAMRERAEMRGGIEAELRNALVANELFVVYQPVVDLHAGGEIDRSSGVEALVRWRHPTRGVVPPIEFIGVAEESGLIRELGAFVLATACGDFVRWQRELGPNAPRLLAVNLSRAQLADAEWSEKVNSILQTTGMKPHQLQLEITESLAAQDATIQARLHELKALGIKLALDDFGTGYSSLACLHLLPVDTVKIDRSFVCQVDSSPHHRVLIEATVRVAHSLGMDTVAEGIETEAQAEAVASLRCNKGQGYMFSRPLMADDLVQWMAASDKSPVGPAS